MAFLFEGVKSPCPRGVLKILDFVLGVKKKYNTITHRSVGGITEFVTHCFKKLIRDLV